MKVPFRLRRLETARPARALLLASHDSGELVELLCRVKSGVRVYHVAEGFLVCLDGPTTAAVGGTIRLQMPYANIYVPVDAELIPALLDDEARGLVRERGLVFLPNGRALAFVLQEPVKLAKLLAIGERREGSWQPLPEAPQLADRIHKIALELPAQDPDRFLAEGNEDVASDKPRPEATGPVSEAVGKALLGAGKALLGLGKLFGLCGLAAAGAGLLDKALQMAPRLTEGILGKQEAALRDLLRRFREGNLEDALRRAIPFGAPGDRGGFAGWGTSLPLQQWLYSLSGLLGGGGSGAGAIWLGSYDVQRELEQEYRKAAERAAQQGDFRRAALIYARLLRDYRAAAQVLLRGGLFHDAAVVFLKKLGDRRAAAQAFESAREFDRALHLYRQLDDHLAAAALLRKLGDLDAALAEYQLAARQHAERGDYLAAGAVMAEKAQRSDLALPYYVTGWQRRPAGNAVPCALRLAELYADRGELEQLVVLADEARDFFEPPGNDASAEQFYSTLAQLAARTSLEPVREELRDRALVGLAVKLRQCAAAETTPGIIVSTLLGRSGQWPAAVVRDAQVAVAAAIKERAGTAAGRVAGRVRIGTGQVTAAARAPHTGEIFVGFKSGDVISFRPTTGEIVRIKAGDGSAVKAISAGPEGQTLLVLQGSGQANLSSYSRSLDGGYLLNIALLDSGNATYWLPPVLSGESDCWYVVGNESFMQMRTVHSVLGGELRPPVASDQVETVLVFAAGDDATDGVNLLLYTRNMIWHTATLPYATQQPESFNALALGWTPGLPQGSSLRTPPLSCLRYGSELELAGVDEEGVLHWSRLTVEGGALALNGACDLPGKGGYLAATLVRPGLVAAVSSSRVDWHRPRGNQFALQRSADLHLPEAVACFASAATNELLILCRDGTVERVPLPAA